MQSNFLLLCFFLLFSLAATVKQGDEDLKSGLSRQYLRADVVSIWLCHWSALLVETAFINIASYNPQNALDEDDSEKRQLRKKYDDDDVSWI